MSKEIIYNKLVRDRIPEIIQLDGKQCIIHKAGDAEYREHLRQKIGEELDEFSIDPSLEEAADIMEVVLSLFAHHNLDYARVEEVRQQKSASRGGFEQRIILEKVLE